jgi:TDG/mug DNA glycosylase family protein
LLREKGTADRDRQKALRGQLRRRFDFYISDFAAETGGFTASDFDALVARGTIEIADDPAEPSPEMDKAEASVEQAADVLPDVLETELRVIFCGTAVGTRSARVGAYYAGAGNQFWAVLARTRLTPRMLEPDDFRDLPQYGIGLTDLAKFVSGADAEVWATSMDSGGFRAKIAKFAPRALAFNGKRAAETFFSRPVSYGRQAESVAGAATFVLPSTSGAARGYWDESYWQELAQFLETATS